MKEQPQHFHKDAEPTVIHEADADQTALERWLRRGMENGPGFWALVLGVVIAGFVAFYLFQSFAFSTPPVSRAWMAMMVPSVEANDPILEGADSYEGYPPPVRTLLRLADADPDTPAACWARYRAACELYQEGLRDLPNGRAAAGPILSQALGLFEKAVEGAKPGEPLLPLASLGIARTYESRGELAEAKAKYLAVAEQFPDFPLAANARSRAESLEDPAVVKFYEQFASADFSTFRETGPASGVGGLDSIFNPPPLPEGFDASGVNSDSAVPPGPAPDSGGIPAGGMPELPADLFPKPPDSETDSDPAGTVPGSEPASSELPATPGETIPATTPPASIDPDSMPVEVVPAPESTSPSPGDPEPGSTPAESTTPELDPSESPKTPAPTTSERTESPVEAPADGLPTDPFARMPRQP